MPRQGSSEKTMSKKSGKTHGVSSALRRQQQHQARQLPYPTLLSFEASRNGLGAGQRQRRRKPQPSKQFVIFEDEGGDSFAPLTPPGQERPPKRPTLAEMPQNVADARTHTGAAEVPDAEPNFPQPNMLAPSYAAQPNTSEPATVPICSPLFDAMLAADSYRANDKDIKSMYLVQHFIHQNFQLDERGRIVFPTFCLSENGSAFEIDAPVFPPRPWQGRDNLFARELEAIEALLYVLQQTEQGWRDPLNENRPDFAAAQAEVEDDADADMVHMVQYLRRQHIRYLALKFELRQHRQSLWTLFAWQNGRIKAAAGHILTDIHAAVRKYHGPEAAHQPAGRQSAKYWEARDSVLFNIKILLTYCTIEDPFLDPAIVDRDADVWQALCSQLNWLRGNNFDWEGRVKAMAVRPRYWDAMQGRDWEAEGRQDSKPLRTDEVTRRKRQRAARRAERELARPLRLR